MNEIGLKEYSKELGLVTEEQKLKLKKIIKKEKRTIFYIVDFVLTVALIGLILFAQINGAYERDTLIFNCKGDMIENINEYDVNITYEDWLQNEEGIKQELKWQKG